MAYLMFNYEPKILALAFIGGVFPALLWLYFWVKGESHKLIRKRSLGVIFIIGMVSVICVLPVQKFLQSIVSTTDFKTIAFAGAEEFIKYIPIAIIFYRKPFVDDHIEWPIYMITVALGFAAMENTLFLIKPIALGQNTVGLLTGQLRFLGSTLLHSVSSGILGISLGISLHFSLFKRIIYTFLGLILAIALHSIFNFFIIKSGDIDFLKIFAFLWIITVIMMLLFEKVRRMH